LGRCRKTDGRRNNDPIVQVLVLVEVPARGIQVTMMQRKGKEVGTGIGILMECCRRLRVLEYLYDARVREGGGYSRGGERRGAVRRRETGSYR